ncbi:MAG TPA: hypothetical protein VEZ20_02000 [Allosphingosinicella sp.]|nr:hypothetical protein [Allosphingosinicella sp.]
MPKFYPEAAFFCLAWVALAVVGLLYVGWHAGLALSVGLFLIIMPTSALTLSRTGNFTTERAVRWGILVVAALILFSVADLSR